MKRRCRHHHHFYQHHTSGPRKSRGFIKRTIKGLARKFGVSKRTVIIGFIVLFLFTKIFTLLAFFLAYYWVRNPGKFENFFDATLEKTRRAFDNMKGRTNFGETVAAYAPEASYGASYGKNEFDFSELKQKFDDLEKRTNGIEEQVSSDEYQLNKEFDNLRSPYNS